MGEKYKVLGFDSWTGGAKFYSNFRLPLLELNADIKLIHLGSWGADVGRPLSEVVEGLPVYDISWYEKNSVFEILEREKPDVVVFLSTDTFSHRAINRICKMQSIPTMHVYHGIMNALPNDTIRDYKVNILNQAKFVTERILKMLFRVWPFYINELIRSGGTFADWRRFFSDNISFALAKKIPKSAPDAKAGHCCVFVDIDVSHAKSKYGYSSDEVSVVGNPDLPKFGLRDDQIGSGLASHIKKTNEIFYIDTALVFRGSLFQDCEEFLSHLLETRDEIQRLGKKMVVKLHPQHFRTGLPAKLETCGIDVCDDDSFATRLSHSVAAIVEPSSASLIPALLGIPILLGKYGKLKDQKYGRIFEEYSRSTNLFDLGSLGSKLDAEIAAFDEVKCREWIFRNAGPLPSDDMPRRVAKEILSLTTMSK